MQLISYFFIKTLLYVISLTGLRGIRKFAYYLTPICYRLIPKYRKRALSNLALAKELSLTNTQIEIIAKQSLFHLLVTAFEYGLLDRKSCLKSICQCLNPEETDTLLNQKQGVIFFCGHQSNWELLFLDATSRHPGVCIGKPIKNKRLYDFILSIRQKFLGSVIIPKDAYKGCMKALKRGELVGIVGDQGLTESSFTYNCLGRTAHMTTLPALLSVRSGCPVYVASIIRTTSGYDITYTGPIVPKQDCNDPIHDITLQSLEILDEKIKQHPEQWMWQHNRWKIAYPPFIPKKYKHDAIAIILPSFYDNLDHELEMLKNTYKGAYFIFFKPKDLIITTSSDELISYVKTTDCFIKHYGPKLLIDLVGIKGLKKHFKKLSVFEYIECDNIKKLIQSWEKAHAN